MLWKPKYGEATKKLPKLNFQTEVSTIVVAVPVKGNRPSKW